VLVQPLTHRVVVLRRLATSPRTRLIWSCPRFGLKPLCTQRFSPLSHRCLGDPGPGRSRADCVVVWVPFPGGRAPACRCVPMRCTTAGFDASPRLRPTLFAPKTHDFRPGALPPPCTNRVESIPFGSWRVRVQIVNANPAVQKSAGLPFRAAQERAASCNFITEMTSFSCEGSSVARFTNSAP
jgi:hypothetical protein